MVIIASSMGLVLLHCICCLLYVQANHLLNLSNTWTHIFKKNSLTKVNSMGICCPIRTEKIWLCVVHSFGGFLTRKKLAKLWINILTQMTLARKWWSAVTGSGLCTLTSLC